MSYNLFLDDTRSPEDVANYIMPDALKLVYRLHSWKIVRHYDAFVNAIERLGLPNVISFDHDLSDEHYAHIATSKMYKELDTLEKVDKFYEEAGFEEKTGYDCAKWLCNYCLAYKRSLPHYIIHSMNPTGGENIKNYLENFKRNIWVQEPPQQEHY